MHTYGKKRPGMVVQRTFIKGHSFVYRLYIYLDILKKTTKMKYGLIFGTKMWWVLGELSLDTFKMD